MNFFRFRDGGDSERAGGGLDENRSVAEETGENVRDGHGDIFDFIEREIGHGFFEEAFLGDLAEALVGYDINGEVPEEISITETEEAEGEEAEKEPEHPGVVRPEKHRGETGRKTKDAKEKAFSGSRGVATKNELDGFALALAFESLGGHIQIIPRGAGASK